MSRLFKRNKKTTIAELEEYYANQERKKSSTGMAWFMAFISLLITLVVIALLFLGGRWVYRTLTDNNDTGTTTTEVAGNDGVELPTFDSDNGVVGQGNTNSGKPNLGETVTKNPGTVSDEAASTSESNVDRVNDSIIDSSVTEVPNTGAGELLVIMPVLVAVIGYFIARRQIVKNN
jgi:hypothetical protein